MRGFRNRKSVGSGAVRAKKLDDTLDALNDEMSQKVARSIADYHTMILEPRLKWLETPWWKYKSIRPPNLTADRVARKAAAVEEAAADPDVIPIDEAVGAES